MVHVRLPAAHTGIRWVGYLSTTGVYGDHQGGWVDETDAALAPSTKRVGRPASRLRRPGRVFPTCQLHVFRLGRHLRAWARSLCQSPATAPRGRIIKQGQVFSRIHVEDIASGLELSLNSPKAGAIYNMCDDDPAPPEDVIGHAAQLLGLPVPPAVAFEEAEMTPMARSFYAESKRVRNDLIKRELGWVPRYPNYRSGLAAMLALKDR